jgi:hypothetical protein
MRIARDTPGAAGRSDAISPHSLVAQSEAKPVEARQSMAQSGGRGQAQDTAGPVRTGSARTGGFSYSPLHRLNAPSVSWRSVSASYAVQWISVAMTTTPPSAMSR